MLDARTGRLLHTAALTTATGALVFTVDEADGRLFVGEDVRFEPFHGVVQVFDTRTGAFMRRVSIGRSSSPDVVAVDERHGRAFIINRPAGTVSVLDARRGVVLRTVAVGMLPTAMAVDEHRGGVVVGIGRMSAGGATSPGWVRVLDARTGTILSSATIGWGPGAVAVDERTGHAFVTNGGSAMRVPDFWGRLPSWLRARLPFLPRPSFRTRPVPGSVSMIVTAR